MRDASDRHQTLDLALQVGELLLSNGAGAADVTATMENIARHAGLRQVDVDVTFTSLAVGHRAGPEEPVMVLNRRIVHRETDFADLTAVDHTVRAFLADQIDRDEAEAQIARIASSGHPRPRWAITLGSGVTAAGVALLLGGTGIVLATAAVSGASIEILQRRMDRLRLPSFYAQVAGGFLATLFAVVLRALEVPVSPSVVVTSCIVMLLAGLGFIGAIQDALTGFYVTANARVLEVLIATAGIIVGVAAGLAAGSAMGVEIYVVPGASGWAGLPQVAGGAAVAAAGFAFTAYSPKRVLAPIGLVGATAASLAFWLSHHGVDRAATTGAAAVMIGLVSYRLSAWLRVPPLVVIVAGIVPLLPGLSIYRALSLLAADDVNGVIGLIAAATVALSLAAGAIFGEYIAQPLWREARRVERRLAGPRLVGPLRRRSRRTPRE
ncbi:MAG: threonine/serine exporter family protein [Aeromicrobium sp.]|uniref:threonine/serine ThrE exporter family protein n=1 Tax=Aeromicrobium sp. TaxID=1871063 RepID=UPI0039E46450